MRGIAEFRQVIRETVGRSVRFATVQRVHGDRIDVRAGGSAKRLRGLEVVGGVDGLLPGDTVLLTVAGGRVYAESMKARSGNREVVYGIKSGDGGGGGAGLVVHDIAGALHTASGLEVGWVLRATGATTFAWMALGSAFLNCIMQLGIAGEEVVQYAGTAVGMAAAIAAAETGDVFWMPNRTITGDYTLPADTYWVGVEEDGAILTGEITLSNNTTIFNLSIVRSDDSGDDLKGVIAASSGVCKVKNCIIYVAQDGAGGAYAVNVEGNGNIKIRESYLFASSVSGDGFAVFHVGGDAVGNSYQYGGDAYGSEDYTNVDV